MAERKPWFLVMTPDDANHPDALWVRRAAASHGKRSLLPIAPEGWIALVAFVLVLVGALAAIWIGAYRAGALSFLNAVVVSVMTMTVVVLGFIWLVRVKMTSLPPTGGQSR